MVFHYQDITVSQTWLNYRYYRKVIVHAALRMVVLLYEMARIRVIVHIQSSEDMVHKGKYLYKEKVGLWSWNKNMFQILLFRDHFTYFELCYVLAYFCYL